MIPSNLKAEWSKENINVALPNPDGTPAEPIYVDVPMLTLSWEIQPDEMDYREVFQNAYRVAIYRNGACVWESGKTESSDMHCVVSNPPECGPDDFGFWTVTLWDGNYQLTDTVSAEL